MTATQINLSERSENVAISKKKGLHLNLYLISWFSSPKSSVLLKKKKIFTLNLTSIFVLKS